jgi:hypothetical protein
MSNGITMDQAVVEMQGAVREGKLTEAEAGEKLARLIAAKRAAAANNEARHEPDQTR